MSDIEEIFEGLDEFESLNQSTTDKVLQVEQELHDTITRLRSLVEATETDLFEQKKKRRRLEKENADIKANWADLKVYIAEDECLEKSFVLEEMNNLERS